MFQDDLDILAKPDEVYPSDTQTIPDDSDGGGDLDIWSETNRSRANLLFR